MPIETRTENRSITIALTKRECLLLFWYLGVAAGALSRNDNREEAAEAVKISALLNEQVITQL